MMARTHVVAGAACWVAFAVVTKAPIDVLHIVVAMGSSLLPDIDHPGSVFGRRVRPISTLLGAIFGHRGITHSLLAVFALAITTVYFGGFLDHLVSAITIGYLSHLLADWMTPYGVPLLYPSMRRYSSPLTTKTGGVGELLIQVSMIGGLVLFFSRMFS